MKQQLIEQIDTILHRKPDPLHIRKSTANIVKNTKHVQIDGRYLQSLALILKQRIQKGTLLTTSQFGSKNVSPQLIFLQDTVNFCFWAEKGKERWTVEYPKGTVTNGWYALTASFERALDEGIPLLDCSYLVSLSSDDAKHIFRSSNRIEIPLLDERVHALREAGKNLKRNFHGDVENLIAQCKKDAIAIAKETYEQFPSFRDVAKSNNEKVYFLKRVQIFPYDLSLLPGMNISHIEQLTVFPDYKLPQLLRSFGVLTYNSKLSQKVDALVLIPQGSREEIEIRASTVWAGELLSNMLGVSAAMIDNALWLLGSEKQEQMKPYHKTYSTYY